MLFCGLVGLVALGCSHNTSGPAVDGVGAAPGSPFAGTWLTTITHNTHNIPQPLGDNGDGLCFESPCEEGLRNIVGVVGYRRQARILFVDILECVSSLQPPSRENSALSPHPISVAEECR